MTFADQISDDAHEYVIALDKAITAQLPEGVIETVPALVNLLIDFDPIMTVHSILEEKINTYLEGLNTHRIVSAQR